MSAPPSYPPAEQPPPHLPPALSPKLATPFAAPRSRVRSLPPRKGRGHTSAKVTGGKEGLASPSLPPPNVGVADWSCAALRLTVPRHDTVALQVLDYSRLPRRVIRDERLIIVREGLTRDLTCSQSVDALPCVLPPVTGL